MNRITPALVATTALFSSQVVWIAVSRHSGESTWGGVGGLVALLVLLFALLLPAARSIDRMKPRTALLLVWTGAILFRLTVIPAGLTGPTFAGLTSDLTGAQVSFDRYLLYDDDLWRFLWEGHLVANGHDPYLVSPDVAAELRPETVIGTRRTDWEEIADRVNHPSHSSTYPPLAQLFFALAHAIAPGSVAVWKLLIACVDLATVGVLLRMARPLAVPMSAILLYAWNPLVIKVGAGSGHFDALVGLTLALTAYFVIRRRHTLAALSFAAAVLAKASPILLAPLVARRIGWKNTMIVATAITGPLLLLGSSLSAFATNVATFGRDWMFNAGFFRAVVAVSGADAPARLGSILAIGTIIAVMTMRSRSDRDFPSHAGTVMGAALLAGPVVMPWYVVWFLPLTVIAGQSFWTVLSLLVCAALFVMVDGIEYPLVLAIEYGLAVAFLIVRCGRHWPHFVSMTRLRKEILQ